jgi:crotonobetainyl-CoA:carnitine CoA-transferase CaiB-like acyl-CoA transferase
MAAPITALEGVRVLDFSKVLAGPLCAQYLGDMGADVVKVEPVDHGDDTRRWPPFRPDGAGTIFLSANRNKRSLALDLKSPAGRALCARLVARADVVIESFGPGVAERLGLGWDTVHALNPRTVLASISGYGSTGPMRTGKGYDLILQAFSGMLSITGERGGPAVRSPFSPVDQGTGLHALAGILAALLERARTGVGRHVEASLFDTSVGFLAYFLQGFWERGTEPEKPGSGHESLCPYEAFATADKPLILGVANDALWHRFCAVAECMPLRDDPRFATNAARVAHREETVGHVREIMRRRTRADWLDRLGDAGIPCSPVHSLGELSAHPHTRAVEMIFDYASMHGETSPLPGVAQPLRFDGVRPAARRRPPALGEHSRDVLSEIGCDDAEFARLVADGVVRG